MIVRSTDEIDRLRRENRELREEIMEWRRQDPLAEAKREMTRARVERLQAEFYCTPSQAKMLLHLMLRSPAAVSRNDLFDVARQSAADDSAVKIVDVQMSKLRKLLAAEKMAPIQTVRGVGYAMDKAGASVLWALLNSDRQERAA